MAKQVGPLFFTGTIDGLIFYKLGDQYYTRSKGSYKCRKQMRRDPKYKRTIEIADQFGQASNLTKEVYYCHLPKAVRKHGLFGKLTGLVNGWLQQGKSREEIKEALICHCQRLATASTTVAPVSAPALAVEAKSTVSSGTTASRCTPKVKAITSSLQPHNVPVKTKQARYLSHWKVKLNGRLHIPKRHVHATRLLSVLPPPVSQNLFQQQMPS
jgi:hypothetical protein